MLPLVIREYPHTTEYHAATCGSKKKNLEGEQRLTMTVDEYLAEKARIDAEHKRIGTRPADTFVRFHACVTKAIKAAQVSA